MYTVLNIFLLEKGYIGGSHVVSQPEFVAILRPVHHIHALIASESPAVHHLKYYIFVKQIIITI